MELGKIQKSVQQIVLAIAEAMKIEVEVADQNLIRIAGTGIIKSLVWENMRHEDYVYRHCLETGKAVIVKHPGEEEICKSCIHYKKCKELGEICCPIIANNQVIGVIGLLAFNQTQRDKLFGELEANLNFLTKMAELIASKMLEHHYEQKESLLKQKISTGINFLEQGIILINSKMECEYINSRARQLFGLSDEDKLSTEQCRNILEQSKFNTHKNGYDSLIENKDNGNKSILHAEIRFISYEDKEIEYVVILQDTQYIMDVATKLGDKRSEPLVEIVGQHFLMFNMKEKLQQAYSNELPILLVGEKGTGKSYISKCFHKNSSRRNQPFISIDCSMYKYEELNLLLFGSEHLEETNVSVFQQADGGTVYLENIDQLHLSQQYALLNFLNKKTKDNQTFEPSLQFLKETRFMASTTINLGEMVKQGSFRDDLFYKLNVFKIEVPKLKDRQEDIINLATAFLIKYTKLLGKPMMQMTDYFKGVLLHYDWPGNIPELDSVIEYCVHTTKSRKLTKESLPLSLQNITVSSLSHLPDNMFSLKNVEKETILRALQYVSQRHEPKEKAAELLGIGRATLFRKLQEYGL